MVCPSVTIILCRSVVYSLADESVLIPGLVDFTSDLYTLG